MRYFTAQVEKFGKWGTNLARCGIEAALRLVKPGGYCAAVSPASLLSDQVSANFRRWIFSRYTVCNIDHYKAKAKLFGKADVESVTLLTRRGTYDAPPALAAFSENLTPVYRRSLPPDEMDYVKRNDYVFPLSLPPEAIPILAALENLPPLSSYEKEFGLKFARELDETRIQERLRDRGDVTFIKGCMTDRFSFRIPQRRFADPDKVKIPRSAFLPKIVWRDVSRNSQSRRMKATLIPPGYVAGNSLGVAYLENADEAVLKYVLALMNSYVFETQVRYMLATNHVSAGVLRKARVPDLRRDSGFREIVECAGRRLAGDASAETRLECLVARAYGLRAREFETIVGFFETPPAVKRELARLSQSIL